VFVYPSHNITGRNDRYGRCPGSGVWMLRDGSVHASEHARLAEHFEIWAQVETESRHEERQFDDFAERAARLVEERMRRRNGGQNVPIAREGLDVPEEPRRAKDENGMAARRRRRGSTGDPPGIPLGVRPPLDDNAYPSGQELEDISIPTPSEVAAFEHGGLSLGVGPDRPSGEFFPGRPGDAPEPGPGEAPVETVPWDAPITGETLGRRNVDNARDQLQALLAAVVEQAAQGQETLAKATAMVESLGSYRAAAEQAVIATESLVGIAVGMSSELPQSAQEMRASILLAKDRLSAETGELNASLSRAQDLISDVFGDLNAAIESARTFAASV
jgi:hypothetical protein